MKQNISLSAILLVMPGSSEKCVAIIGAGVAGLVTAGNMLKVGIQPTVFEKTSGIGGLWNPDTAPSWNSLRTNVSKFWTSLPDLTWYKDVSLFPTQREVFVYLSKYAQQFLPPDVILLNTNVTNIARSDHAWVVHYCTSDGQSASRQFDFAVVTSGPYAQAQIPKDIVGLSSFPGTILHSSEYRSPEQVRNRRVIVVGASVSAAEIAGDMAWQADHIIHVTPRQFRLLPRVTPIKCGDPASAFLPMDFNFHRRSTRASPAEVIFRNEQDYRNMNAYLRSLIGGDQPFSNDRKGDDNERPFFVAISDMYLGWHRAGRIRIEHARLLEVNSKGALILNNGHQIETTSDDVLVLCTGYRPDLSFFAPEILEELSYKPDDIFHPLILYRGMLSPNLPGLAFNGTGRGTFWINLHLQSRWLAALFSGTLSPPSMAEQQIGIETEHRIRNLQPRPQYPHPDPVGVANDLAKDLALIPANTTDSILLTQFRTDGPDLAVLNEYNTILEAALQGRFVPGVLYRAWHGSKWTYERTCTQQSTTTVTRGEAHFDLDEHGQLLYSEKEQRDGALTQSLDVNQKYIYLYDESTDDLAAYFVMNDGTRGSLFHKLQFQRSDSSEPAGWAAVGEYQSGDGHHLVSYLFVFAGIQLARFDVNYMVTGSTNDYALSTTFLAEDSVNKK